jgi:predicted SAM-dependent methyltransferase
VIVELGCGVTPTERADIHHDRIRHSKHVDVVWNLQDLPWPWQDDTIDELIAIDVFEHLTLYLLDGEFTYQAENWWWWLDEAHRIVKPGGQLTMRLPAWDNPLSYRDPTHQRVFHEETFGYWDPCTHVWQDFGRIYGLRPRWHNALVSRENGDFRYMLRKLPTDLCSASPVPVPKGADTQTGGGTHEPSSTAHRGGQGQTPDPR